MKQRSIPLADRGIDVLGDPVRTGIRSSALLMAKHRNNESKGRDTMKRLILVYRVLTACAFIFSGVIAPGQNSGTNDVEKCYRFSWSTLIRGHDGSPDSWSSSKSEGPFTKATCKTAQAAHIDAGDKVFPYCSCFEPGHETSISISSNSESSRASGPAHEPAHPPPIDPVQAQAVNELNSLTQNAKDRYEEQMNTQNQQNSGQFAGGRPSTAAAMGAGEDPMMAGLERLTDPDAIIADALEKDVVGSERSATMATWHGGDDADADGYKESVRIGLPDDWSLVATDLDHDGNVDQVQYFDAHGVQREPAPSGVDLEGTSDPREGSGQLNQFLYLANQPARAGEDGHATHLTAPDGSDVVENGPKIYSLNGVATTNEKAISTGNDIRLMHGTPVEVIYNQTDGLPQDLVESLRTKSGNFSNTFTQVASRSIANDLANGEQVRVFAHSEGAALTEASIYPIKAELQQRGMSDRLRNLTIVTLGGYSDKAENWPSGVNVIAVNNNDIVPLIGGNAHGSFDPTNTQGSIFPTLANHSLTNYYPWIRIFANPSTDLTPLYGGSFSAKDWNWISTVIGP